MIVAILVYFLVILLNLFLGFLLNRMVSDPSEGLSFRYVLGVSLIPFLDLVLAVLLLGFVVYNFFDKLIAVSGFEKWYENRS